MCKFQCICNTTSSPEVDGISIHMIIQISEKKAYWNNDTRSPSADGAGGHWGLTGVGCQDDSWGI
jgi:hypothetical protein